MSQTSETASSQELEISGLVRRVIKGDVEAYGELYNLCLYRIYRYVFNQVGSTALAEDITEEVFIRAWKAIKTCQGKEHTFIPWLYRIAHNYTIDTYRKGHKEVPVGNIYLTDSIIPENEIERNQELQEVLEAVKNLPEMQKQVILLKYLEGIDNSEISRILGKREGAIRVLQMRALHNLRAIFNSGKDSYDR
jgi:RNA polymerase sigma-70 factor, ECF subfamily